jgi:polysaccharide biosynthesis transport protein
MELKAIWNTILRRKWIIIQAFLVILLSAIIGSYLLTPSYKATSKILIKRSEPESYILSNIGFKTVDLPSVASMKIEDHIELVVARPVLERVISKLQLNDRKGNKLKTDDFRNYTMFIYELFPRPCFEVEVLDNDELDTVTSNQIKITARSTSPEEATVIANTLAEEYIVANLRMKKDDYKTARNYIEKQIDAVKAKYINALENIKNLQIKTKTVDIDTEKQEAVSKVYQMMDEEKNAVISISEAIARIKELQKQLDKQNEEKISNEINSENSYLAGLRTTIMNLEQQLSKELSEKTSAHPDVIALNNQLKKAKGDLKKEIDNTNDASTEKQKLERDIVASVAHRKSLVEEVAKYMAKISTIPQKGFDFAELTLNYTVNQQIYNSMLNNLNELIAAEDVISPDIKLVESAAVQDINKPYSPNTALTYIVGIFLASIFGFGLGFLIDYLDDTLKGVEEVKEHGLKVLGFIPKIKRQKNDLILSRNPKNQLLEFYRLIRNNIKFSSVDRPLKSLLIISAVKGEGRSVVVINLGKTFANEGKKVLIVDSDFRNPMIDKIIGVSMPDGITNILTENAIPQDVIKKIENIDGLSLLSAGSPPPDPGQMIESDRMRQLISDLSRQYDIVILDSSPLLLSNDAILLAQYVDASILVLESGRISHNSFSRTIEHLKNANIQIAGVIVNKAVERRRGRLL